MKNLNRTTSLIQNAKYLRKNQTLPEELLWKGLRNRKFLGLKFRRQYPVDGYIIDFFCFEKKLGIELDGVHHGDSDVKIYDNVRTLHLKSYDIKIMRFSNTKVLYDIDGVLEMIRKYCV